MADPTPKERYEARKELRRIAKDAAEPSDADLQAEYLVNLAERFVAACESFARSFSNKSF